MIDLFIIKIARTGEKSGWDYCVYEDLQSAMADLKAGDQLYKAPADGFIFLGKMKYVAQTPDTIEMEK